MISTVTRHMSIKGLLSGILLCVLAPVLCFAQPGHSEAWFIDLVKYHVSVHGQLSCQDCHSDIVARKIHPNPSDVTRKLRDFFHPDTCFNCHDGDSIKENLLKGLHGGKPIQKEKDYSKCLTCHDPHYQPGLGKKSPSGVEASSSNTVFCASCHKKRESLPHAKSDDMRCMECHEAFGSQDKSSRQYIDQFCLKCHGLNVVFSELSVPVPRIDKAKHISQGHKRLDCLACHSGAASFEHNLQKPVACSQCHTPHDEATLHDAHSKVSCQDCHLTGIGLSMDPQTKRIVWERLRKSSDVSPLNIIIPSRGIASCKGCHKKGNHLGAVAMVLPAKSVLCIPCHAGTFTIGDPITIIAILGFVLGMLAVISVWFTGTTRTRINKTELLDGSFKPPFHIRLFIGLKALFIDGLLQRRLFRRSHFRWFIHALIFWPFVIRFTWGLVALIGSLLWPSNPWVWQMLDKNNPVTAVLFDLTGVLVLFGIILAIFRSRMTGDEKTVNGLPERDWLAVTLLAAIIIVGFILEGARIALTGEADINHFAFVGWTLSFLWIGVNGLSELYGYIWYLHALLTGVFVIYLPFSGMLHLIMAPLVMALNSADTDHSSHS